MIYYFGIQSRRGHIVLQGKKGIHMKTSYGGMVYLMLALAVGCSTTVLVAPPGKPGAVPYAPLNEKERPGIMKYYNEGSESTVRQRRNEAYKQMYTLCGGCYEIVWEGPIDEAVPDSAIHGRYAAVDRPQEYLYIKFRCVKCDK